MHVVAVTPLYPPGSRVGAWLATHGLLSGLPSRGHTVEVVPLLPRPGSRYEIDGVQVVPHSDLTKALDRADVIVSHAGDRAEAHRAARTLKKPSVRMVHGGRLDLSGLSGAALVICNSEATRASVSRWIGRKVVVHPPTDLSGFATTPGDKVTLVNLSSPKGGDVFWRLARSMADVEFLGVQGGYGNQMIYDLPNVEVIETTENMRDDVFGRTKLLLMPSAHESWGMVGIEALASGIPTLARPTPGLRESLGRAGNWCDSTSTSKWTAEIRRLLEPEAWQEASGRALARAEQIDPEGERDQFAQALESVVKGKAK